MRAKDDIAKMMNLEAEINYFKQANEELKDEVKRMEMKVYETRTEVEYASRER